MNVKIESMRDADWEAVKLIYKQGIATQNATFESKAPDWEQWNKDHLSFCRLVARLNDELIGWAALSPVSNRCVYAGVVEVSLYIATNFRGKGIGKRLLKNLIADAESNGIWTLQAGIFPENKASIALHQKFGFRIVGIREKIGQINGVWRDVVLMERRSKVVGAG